MLLLSSCEALTEGHTVNLEFFVRVLFSRNLAYAKFRENVVRVLFSRNFAYAKYCENRILAKWSNHSVVN